MHTEIVRLLLVYFSAVFLLALVLRNASILDIFWGAGFVLVAWVSHPGLADAGWPQNLSLVFVTLWGIRLTAHILRRNWRKPEDFRYQEFRRQWGRLYPLRAYVQLFLGQGLFLYLISLGFLWIHTHGSLRSAFLVGAGALVWGIGFGFEAIGDAQLRAFLRRPENRGRILQEGLWRYTRHPNYFGEATLWWGIFLMAWGMGAPLYTLLSPLTITILVRLVSGVPMLEKSFASVPGYAAYQARTPIFFPWFPRRGTEPPEPGHRDRAGREDG